MCSSPTAHANGPVYCSWSAAVGTRTGQPPQSAGRVPKPLIDKGFTVFGRSPPGSSPKFSIPKRCRRASRRAIHPLQRDRWAVDPERLGVYGYSAGGHLSLMLGTASDAGDPQSKDPILKISDRVQAVVAFVAPTDLRIMVWKAPGHLPAYDQFPALTWTSEAASQMSPLLHVSADDPPTLLIAGDKDDLVPIKHSRDIQAVFQTQGVTSQLIEIAGAGHGFAGEDARRATVELVAWFEKHLAKK